MLGNLMIAAMATGLAGAPACTDDLQSARAISVDPVEVSANDRSNAGINSVDVLATIGADGRVAHVATLDVGASEQVERAVEHASSRWTFEPAQACGEAVAQEVVFELPVLATRFSRVQDVHTPGPTNDPRGDHKPAAPRQPWENF